MRLRSTARETIEIIDRGGTEGKPGSRRYLLPIDTQASFCPILACEVPSLMGTPQIVQSTNGRLSALPKNLIIGLLF
jgi:hypothetical protein